jgi:hypothetical protein
VVRFSTSAITGGVGNSKNQTFQLSSEVVGKHERKQCFSDGSPCILSQTIRQTTWVIHAAKVIPDSVGMPLQLSQMIEREGCVFQRISHHNSGRLDDIIYSHGFTGLMSEHGPPGMCNHELRHTSTLNEAVITMGYT